MNKIYAGLKDAVRHASGDISGSITTIFSKRLKACFNADDDTLTITHLVSETSDRTKKIDEEDIETIQHFKQMFSKYNRYDGLGFELTIKGFKTDGWCTNRDLTTMGILWVFDISESEAHELVEKFYGACHF